ncbi:hypothetical protein C8K30_103461 [Promicromonospora sp. AC04]|uniref:hypothetical protein n=1 Tax=Promicromonospora sp. AC04 TaxID=2135723 RepID=UPI000D3D432D|nr:hypothetical protein [Promicromonospora sp. AC04]PUB29035.1 hypothetical protein C8K30_103461 [Promicromonospora sp. AC04]
MAAGRILRLDAEQWATVQEQAREGGGGTAVGTALAEHQKAPVRATLVATSGDRGSTARLTLVDGRVLLVLQAIAERDGETVIAPGAELRFVQPENLWAALQAALPPIAALRAPASAVGAPVTDPASAADADGDGDDTAATDSPTSADPTKPRPSADQAWPATALDHEEANLQVIVEAWPTPERPTTVWARLWSVVDGKLLDVRRRGGAITPTQRPAGSVAAELQWALVGAIDAVREVSTELSSES